MGNRSFPALDERIPTRGGRQIPFGCESRPRVTFAMLLPPVTAISGDPAACIGTQVPKLTLGLLLIEHQWPEIAGIGIQNPELAWS